MSQRAVAIGLIATTLLGCQYHAERDRLRGVTESLLRDPSSAQYRNDQVVRHDDGRVYYCGEINARNSYGGYVGFRQFIASVDTATIANPDDTPRNREAFAAFWNRNCASE